MTVVAASGCDGDGGGTLGTIDWLVMTDAQIGSLKHTGIIGPLP